MTVQLTVTTAALSALADNDNRGIRAVALTRAAIGSGTAPAGTDESARTQLRAQHDIGPVFGDHNFGRPGGIAITIRIEPTTTYDATEIGIFARIGAAGEEFLFAYWAGAGASEAAAGAAPGTTVLIVGVVQLGSAPAAEVSIAADVTLNIGTTPASETAAGIMQIATCAEAAAGTDNEKATTPAGLGCFWNARMPAGVVVAFGGDAIPGGWLELNGQAVSRTTYPALFALWGTGYGDGDGSTTFNLPNLARRTIVGAGGVATPVLGNTVGASGGSEMHTLTLDEMPGHSHGGTRATPNHTHGDGTYAAASAGGHSHYVGIHWTDEEVRPDKGEAYDNAEIRRSLAVTAPNRITTSSAPNHTHDVTGRSGAAGSHSHAIPSQGGGGAHSNMPPSLVMRWIVSTG